MDTAKLIEEAERWARNVSESPGNGTAGEDLYGAKLLCDLAAALKASEEQNGAIRRGLDWERAERAPGRLISPTARRRPQRGMCSDTSERRRFGTPTSAPRCARGQRRGSFWGVEND